MNLRKSVAPLLLLSMMAGPAFAQTTPAPVPPANSMKLSEIVAKVEARTQFAYIDEIDWEDDGYYDVTYYTTDKAKVEIKIDPATGEPR
ncbi:PepSY domain-containing protein [Corticibacterium sp. UT-5YL-CI-8]|nr:PepSY domain-containing protein [Tianweitania sp. UT-5YL-CI-8]